MFVGAYDETPSDTFGFGDLLSRADAVLAASQTLRRSLVEKRSQSASLAGRVARVCAELKLMSETLTDTARCLIGDGWRARPLFGELTVRCNKTGRLRLREGHAALAKESLARMAAQLAGRDPDQRVRVELAGEVAFDDHVWRYQDFLDRAERAFAELAP